jgi:predicted TIM-barrel fold metal-dependent hydrolase
VTVARDGSAIDTEPLIDAHAHFYHAESGRGDWEEVNAARFRAGERIGVTYHVASVLGTYGFSSPTYFPSPTDVTRGNDVMLAICVSEPNRTRMFVTVNPNYTDHALGEIERCVARGA